MAVVALLHQRKGWRGRVSSCGRRGPERLVLQQQKETEISAWLDSSSILLRGLPLLTGGALKRSESYEESIRRVPLSRDLFGLPNAAEARSITGRHRDSVKVQFLQEIRYRKMDSFGKPND